MDSLNFSFSPSVNRVLTPELTARQTMKENLELSQSVKLDVPTLLDTLDLQFQSFPKDATIDFMKEAQRTSKDAQIDYEFED